LTQELESSKAQCEHAKAQLSELRGSRRPSGHHKGTQTEESKVRLRDKLSPKKASVSEERRSAVKFVTVNPEKLELEHTSSLLSFRESRGDISHRSKRQDASPAVIPQLKLLRRHRDTFKKKTTKGLGATFSTRDFKAVTHLVAEHRTRAASRARYRAPIVTQQ
jgi:hypothetical protein